MIRRSLACSSLALLVAAIPFSAFSFAGKPQKLSPVSLQVTIASTDDAGNPCAICSDNNTAYIDGQEGISAQITSSGDLDIDFQTGHTPSRYVHFYFNNTSGDPCPSTWNSSLVPPNWVCDYATPDSLVAYAGALMRTHKDPAGTPLQNLNQGESETVGLSWTFPDPLAQIRGSEWRSTFHYSLSDYVGSPAWYANVTCTAVSGNGQCIAWDVEPVPPPGLTASTVPVTLLNYSIPSIKGSSAIYHPSGFFFMPFKLTLKAQ